MDEAALTADGEEGEETEGGVMERHGGAKIIFHSGVFGRNEDLVRWFQTSEPGSYAQYDRCVTLRFLYPGERTVARTEIVPDNTRYITIEDESGNLLYDSRTEVPHDMQKWQAYRDKMQEREWEQIERMMSQQKGSE